MNVNELKHVLLAGFERFYSEGMSEWSRQQVQGALVFRDARFELDDPEVQRILRELENEGRIRLFRQAEKYLEVQPTTS